MMDKQKQIEEMARTTCNYNAKNFESCVECIKGGLLSCDRLVQAEKLYNAGYRKIPEGAVVLTRKDREEFNELYRSALQRVEKWEKLCGIKIKETRKKTAEKFAERLKEKLEENSPIAEYDLEDLEFDGETIQECIDEICKEITEEKV